jgi:hypothetical protein
VNTAEPYERRTDRTVPESPAPSSAPGAAALAVHQDPSLSESTPSVPTGEQAHGSIVWLRPTDLVTIRGAAQLRGAVDAGTDAVRRSRRAPLTVASRLRGRISRSAIARTEPTVRTSIPPSEGVQL